MLDGGLLTFGVTAGADPDFGAKKLRMSLPTGFFSSFLLCLIAIEAIESGGDQEVAASLTIRERRNFRLLTIRNKRDIAFRNGSQVLASFALTPSSIFD